MKSIFDKEYYEGFVYEEEFIKQFKAYIELNKNDPNATQLFKEANENIINAFAATLKNRSSLKIKVDVTNNKYALRPLCGNTFEIVDCSDFAGELAYKLRLEPLFNDKELDLREAEDLYDKVTNELKDRVDFIIEHHQLDENLKIDSIINLYKGYDMFSNSHICKIINSSNDTLYYKKDGSTITLIEEQFVKNHNIGSVYNNFNTLFKRTSVTIKKDL